MKNNVDDLLKRLFDDKAVAVVRLDSDKNIFGMAEAFAEGGIVILEITLTTPGALEIISSLRNKYQDELVIGVGSVLNSRDAQNSFDAGAQFIVSPIMKPEIIKAAKEKNIPALIGAFTPTEIQTAHELGADVVKVFPADVLGMSFFKGVLAPMPHLKLMPTGGVNLDNPGEWIKAGACAVGIGSALVNKTAIENGEFGLIRDNARRVRRSLENA